MLLFIHRPHIVVGVVSSVGWVSALLADVGLSARERVFKHSIIMRTVENDRFVVWRRPERKKNCLNKISCFKIGSREPYAVIARWTTSVSIMNKVNYTSN
jgi:hypothetical protein